MGQKTNPIGFRIGINKQTDSIWFASGQEYIDNLHEDLKIKKYIRNRLSDAMVSDIRIARKTKSLTVDIYTARPGQVIGRQGSEIEKLRNELTVLVNKHRKSNLTVFVNVQEVKIPWTDAKLVGIEIGRQLQNRVSFRRAMKFAIRNAMRNGAQGIKIQCSGRLGGAEMARTERYQEGRTPLHTLRADIDYALTKVNTTYGIIGIKVWIYNGDILK
ncbi:MAG TPA: 30S ribosomal protein S3 [Candidatus Cloacimonas sp.]|nr:small subunit ribosomal protein [Candidatus Cloacimonadota bacterium]HCX72764.1 30S ribosomal protein S3 [Candidatus Cloacimonas sp.]